MFTISLTFYNDHDHIERHLNEWAKYPEVSKQVIDDGSKVPLVLDSVPVYRIEKDIPWNIPGARNLGATVCPTPWILFCDTDQSFSLSSMEKLLKTPLERGKFYSFERKNRPRTCGTLLVHREDFWAVGGYDEDFAGFYGYNDPYLRHLLESHSISEVTLPILCDQYSADCTLDRQPNNELLYRQKLAGKRSNTILRFPWKRV